jgi:hypothetical protein
MQLWNHHTHRPPYQPVSTLAAPLQEMKTYPNVAHTEHVYATLTIAPVLFSILSITFPIKPTKHGAGNIRLAVEVSQKDLIDTSNKETN